ncbi:hypothetical protein KCM76_15695 [Zooshikella marina]|uniref:Uncharacterized protein n=1 Tax=Zooshikella ganghwensis TaxID=202772 RepID=A0A4P9VK19_9GAMM|nr:hypothetical protein [Zooshikella ganghwensis]MBU2707436.1 hypothetical protein [Zooshikella ganghwensis]RDH42674.1 hypothetical protein B9G39_04000 [Zooshikella ganghwensis]
MKGYFFGVLLVLSASTSVASDIVNGWTGNTTISKIHSEATRTLFAFKDVQGTCGHPNFWVLPIEKEAYLEVSKIKHSLLLTAFSAKKVVNVRCENSRITDFSVLE